MCESSDQKIEILSIGSLARIAESENVLLCLALCLSGDGWQELHCVSQLDAVNTIVCSAYLSAQII